LKEKAGLALVVVELEGLETADEKLKVDVGAAVVLLGTPKENFSFDSLDGVVLLLPKLKPIFVPSDKEVTGKDGLDSTFAAASPALKLTNVEGFVVVRLDVSDFLAMPAIFAFFFASNSS
jgi:hypothetical protein